MLSGSLESTDGSSYANEEEHPGSSSDGSPESDYRPHLNFSPRYVPSRRSTLLPSPPDAELWPCGPHALYTAYASASDIVGGKVKAQAIRVSGYQLDDRGGVVVRDDGEVVHFWIERTSRTDLRRLRTTSLPATRGWSILDDMTSWQHKTGRRFQRGGVGNERVAKE